MTDGDNLVIVNNDEYVRLSVLQT